MYYHQFLDYHTFVITSALDKNHHTDQFEHQFKVD